MTRQAKIRVYGQLVKAICILIVAMVVGAMIYAGLLAGTDMPALEKLLGTYLAASDMRISLTRGTLIGLALIGVANAAIMAGGLLALWRLADLFVAGNLFAVQSGVQLRRMGIFALAGAVSSLVSRTLVIAISMIGLDGKRQLVLAFSTNDAFLLLAALLFLILGQVMVLASEMDQENKAFV